MTMDELHNLIIKTNGKIGKEDLLLDVRTPEEYSEGHIAGSQNIPHEGVADHVASLKKYKTLYVFCKAGGRARFASQALKAAGIPVDHLVCIGTSGMMNWEESGYPMVSE